MSRLALALALLLFTAACDSHRFTVRITTPDLDGIETPVPRLVVTFLPYDRDSIIRSLEVRAGARPHTRELDSLFRLFRPPFLELFRASQDNERLRARWDSLTRAGKNDAAPSLADSLTAVRQRLEAARARMARVRAELWPLMDSLRVAVAEWEKRAYGGYDSIGRQTARDRLANKVADTTDALGWVEMVLPRGRWWVTAQAVDIRDPNAEWYWNLPLNQDTVLLSPLSGRNRPRY